MVSFSIHYDEMWIEGNYPFIWRDETWNDVSITSTPPSGQRIVRYWIEDGLLKIKFALPIDSPYLYLTLRIRKNNRIRFERTSQSRPIVPQLDIVRIADPVRYQEVAATQSTLVDWSFRMKERVTYTNSYNEYPKVASTLEYTCRFALVSTYRHSYEEIAATKSSISSWSFAVQQTGVQPI